MAKINLKEYIKKIHSEVVNEIFEGKIILSEDPGDENNKKRNNKKYDIFKKNRDAKNAEKVDPNRKKPDTAYNNKKEKDRGLKFRNDAESGKKISKNAKARALASSDSNKIPDEGLAMSKAQQKAAGVAWGATGLSSQTSDVKDPVKALNVAQQNLANSNGGPAQQMYDNLFKNVDSDFAKTNLKKLRAIAKTPHDGLPDHVTGSDQGDVKMAIDKMAKGDDIKPGKVTKGGIEKISLSNIFGSKGIDKLRKSGITFTSAQEKSIVNYVTSIRSGDNSKILSAGLYNKFHKALTAIGKEPTAQKLSSVQQSRYTRLENLINQKSKTVRVRGQRISPAMRGKLLTAIKSVDDPVDMDPRYIQASLNLGIFGEKTSKRLVDKLRTMGFDVGDKKSSQPSPEQEPISGNEPVQNKQPLNKQLSPKSKTKSKAKGKTSSSNVGQKYSDLYTRPEFKNFTQKQIDQIDNAIKGQNPGRISGSLVQKLKNIEAGGVRLPSNLKKLIKYYEDINGEV